MDTKVIERLLIDRHLGELPDDVSELLDAFIADKPEYSRLHRELTKMLTLATQALNPPHNEEPMPMLPPPRSSATPKQRPLFTLKPWLRAGAVAATLVLAFFLGARTGGPTSSPTTQREILARAEARHDEQTQDGFWSLTKFEQSAPRRQNVGKPNRIDWNAPFSPTWTGERT